jgi:Ca2+-binding EF-hand superfamily protein
MGEFRGPEFFRRIDENGDRRLSEDEVAKLSEIFGELDRNDDGQLDMPELMGFPMDTVGGPPRGDRDFEDRPRPEGEPRPEGDRPREGDAPLPEGDPRNVRPFRTEDLAPRPEGDPRRDAAPPRTEDVAPRPFGDPRREGGPQGIDPRQFFNTLDTDGNGFLSEEETPERLRPSFDDVDVNDDVQLSPEELMAHMQRQLNPRGPDFDTFWSNLDRNEDGFVTSDEMPEGRGEEMLERADADDDGKLSREELRAVMPRDPRPEGGRGAPRPDLDRPDRDRPDADREGGDRPDGDRDDREEGDQDRDDRPDAE